MKYIVFGVLLCFCLVWFLGAENIGSDQLIQLKKRGAIVLDVRTRQEVSEGVIPGAIWADFFLESFKRDVSSLDSEKTYVMVCRSGRRSKMATLMLKGLGFSTVYNYEGGMNRWKSEKRDTSEQFVDVHELKQRSERAADKLIRKLGARLKGSIESDGVARSIKYCKVNVPDIYQEVSEERKFSFLKRATTKPRNQENKASDRERQLLKGMESGKIPVREILVKEGDGNYHYYYPLKIKPLCLNCHGPVKNMDPAVVKALKKEYPKDTATDYKEGELRGLIHLVFGD